MSQPSITDVDRQRIRALHHDVGLTAHQIRVMTGFSRRQVREALRDPSRRRATWQLHFPSPRGMTMQQELELVAFISRARENALMSSRELAQILFNGEFGTSVIEDTLKRLGYARPKDPENKPMPLVHRDYLHEKSRSVFNQLDSQNAEDEQKPEDESKESGSS